MGLRALAGSAFLLRSLINPRTNQPDLVGCEGADVRLVMCRRHPAVGVFAKMGDAQDKRALGAVAGEDNLAILAAFERVLQGVQLKMSLRFFTTVALHAGLVENRFDVRGVRDARFGGSGRQIGGGGGQGQSEGGYQREGGESGRIGHIYGIV